MQSALVWLLGACVVPIVLVLANHKLQQMREDRARDQRRHDELVDRHRQACLDIDAAVVHAMFVSLCLREANNNPVMQTHFTPLLEELTHDMKRFMEGERILAFEGETSTIRAALLACAQACEDVLSSRTPGPVLEQAAAKEALTSLTGAMRAHMAALQQRPTPSPIRALSQRLWRSLRRTSAAGGAGPRPHVGALVTTHQKGQDEA